ncbi:MAG TPA: SRPBCC domain-containing protein [Hyphomicrobiaceae bacterium]|nr:SRPBCC domain-containing protein [Hyphomicrobiaceae bacterium]
MDLVTYLSFNGQCESAFRHYEKVLGGKILMMLKGSDAPSGTPVDPQFRDRVMHARLEVDGRLLMGGDAPGGQDVRPQGFSAHIKIDDPGDAERIFRELSEGGTVHVPLAEAFWARRFGMLTDRFGTPWMVNCEKPFGVPETEGTPFVISRTFEAPRPLLWACFTEEERMKRWWGPKGVRIAWSKIDFRPGGRHHYAMQLPDGKMMWGRQVYREISAPEKIILVNSFSDEFGGLGRHPLAPSWPIELHTVFAFEEAGPAKTKFTVTWTPIYPTTEERAAFDGGHASMTGGWGGTFDQLEEYLKTL